MDRAAFKDFIICKALDVISGNCAYRKYLHQCCENGEDWALKVMNCLFFTAKWPVLNSIIPC